MNLRVKIDLSNESVPFFLLLLCVTFVSIWSFTTGLIGIDFGPHWDEIDSADLVLKSFHNRTLLPGHYTYPGLLNLIGVVIVSILSLPPVHLPVPMTMDLNPPYIFYFRVTTLFIASLTPLWVALTVYSWRRRVAEAAIAAALIGFSWEVAYHSRHFTVDPLLMHGAALSLFVTAGLPYITRRPWIWCLPFVAAGLATSAKYPGLALLVPAFINIFLGPLRDRARRFVVGFLIFLAVLLLTTPGLLLDWHAVAKDVTVVWGYNTDPSGNAMFCIGTGWPYVNMLAAFFSTTAFSHYFWASFLIFTLAIVGAVDLILKEPKQAARVLSFPFSYALFFVTFATYFWVRNFLVLFPFIAVLAARGWSVGWSRLSSRRWAQINWACLIAAILFLNAYWLFVSGQSIARRDPARTLREARSYIDTHPGDLFYLSSDLRADMARLGELPPHVIPEISRADRIGLWEDEIKNKEAWGPTRIHPRLFSRWFGPHEINLNFYARWTVFGSDSRPELKILFLDRRRLMDRFLERLDRETLSPGRL